MSQPKKIIVVGSIIIRDGLVFCARRGDANRELAGKWEFPGGKIESGETPEQALAREMKEECLCEVEVGRKVVSSEFQYDFGVVNLTTYLCSIIEGEPELTEHSEFRWVPFDKLMNLDWAPVDIEAVAILAKGLK
jgi:8-oxo-dGTP diphosphatase